MRPRNGCPLCPAVVRGMASRHYPPPPHPWGGLLAHEMPRLNQEKERLGREAAEASKSCGGIREVNAGLQLQLDTDYDVRRCPRLA